MTDARIQLYSTVNCRFCVQAKAMLAELGVGFDEIDLSRDPAGRAELVKLTGLMTFPQVVIDGKALGGYRELLQAQADGELDAFVPA